MRGITLVSGGLDSALVLRLMASLGVDQVALHCTTIFAPDRTGPYDPLNVRKIAADAGVPLKIVEVTDALVGLVKMPPHGHGSNLNPCIDCRIHMLRLAKSMFDELDARFIITGEVVGQRPMSQQRHSMNLIDREAGVKGLVLRPLSAGLLEQTIPEELGWVDRSKMLKLSGRSRKPQMALAKSLGLEQYSAPAGGCLLTDPGFSRRLQELIDHDPEFSRKDVELVKVGRHFRLDGQTKVVVGRKQEENDILLRLAQVGDILFIPVGVPGPTALLRGNATVDNQCYAAELAVKYVSKAEPGSAVTLEVVYPKARKASDFMEVRAEEPAFHETMHV